MNSTSLSFFVRTGLAIASLMVILFAMTSISPKVVSLQATNAYSDSAKPAIKSPGPMRKLPKRPGYRLSA